MAEAISAEDLALINRLSKSPLTEEQVYAFQVRLCDNEIDRDYERFDTAALEKLAELFVGKSGLFDHVWTAQGQTARLYKTEVVRESTVTAAGDPYCWLKGWAYMLRSPAVQPLIEEIEAGIKKEVSVGCSVSRSVCSICGAESGNCVHHPGLSYNGKLCYFTLQEPTDAYEFSFVAVPAQRAAGVVKRMKRTGGEENLDVDRLADALAARLKAAAAPEAPAEDTGKLRALALLELEEKRF